MFAYENGQRILDAGRGRSWSGAAGLGLFTRLAVGSTSLACAGRARQPVVVVPHNWTIAQRRGERVVVGVDYAGRCESALGYAFDFARRHQLELLAIACWEPDYPYATDASTRAEQLRAGAADARLRLDSALAPWRDKYPTVQARTAVPRLRPVTRLRLRLRPQP